MPSSSTNPTSQQPTIGDHAGEFYASSSYLRRLPTEFSLESVIKLCNTKDELIICRFRARDLRMKGCDITGVYGAIIKRAFELGESFKSVVSLFKHISHDELVDLMFTHWTDRAWVLDKSVAFDMLVFLNENHHDPVLVRDTIDMVESTPDIIDKLRLIHSVLRNKNKSHADEKWASDMFRRYCDNDPAEFSTMEIDIYCLRKLLRFTPVVGVVPAQISICVKDREVTDQIMADIRENASNLDDVFVSDAVKTRVLDFIDAIGCASQPYPGGADFSVADVFAGLVHDMNMSSPLRLMWLNALIGDEGSFVPFITRLVQKSSIAASFIELPPRESTDAK